MINLEYLIGRSPGSNLGALWELFWRSWEAARLLGLLGGLLKPLGSVFGALGGSGCDMFEILGTLDRILEPLGTLLGPLGRVLGLSWESFGRLLGAFWRHLGVVLDLIWHLESIFEAIC